MKKPKKKTEKSSEVQLNAAYVGFELRHLDAAIEYTNGAPLPDAFFADPGILGTVEKMAEMLTTGMENPNAGDVQNIVELSLLYGMSLGAVIGIFLMQSPITEEELSALVKKAGGKLRPE